MFLLRFRESDRYQSAPFKAAVTELNRVGADSPGAAPQRQRCLEQLQVLLAKVLLAFHPEDRLISLPFLYLACIAVETPLTFVRSDTMSQSAAKTIRLVRVCALREFKIGRDLLGDNPDKRLAFFSV